MSYAPSKLMPNVIVSVRWYTDGHADESGREYLGRKILPGFS